MITEPEVQAQAEATQHILTELGFVVRRVEDELVGRASVTQQMCVPGTSNLRTSILAAWADQLTGLLSATAIAPQVPVTIQLDVELMLPAPGSGHVRGRGRVAKAGRSVIFADVEFSSSDGDVFAVCSGSFIASPDPAVSLPRNLSFDGPAPTQQLQVPFAQRAGCERRGAGRAEVPLTQDGLNSANTLNGGLIALAAEEAVLSLAPGATLSSLCLRYLRPVRVGPAVASATLTSGLGQVEVRDTGNEDRLAALATARLFPS